MQLRGLDPSRLRANERLQKRRIGVLGVLLNQIDRGPGGETLKYDQY